MATTDTKKATPDRDSVTGRPGGGSSTDGRPGTGTQGPLADVQHDTKRPGANEEEHEGATEQQVSDRSGPGVGFDQEPEREKDEGGVS